MTEETYQGTVTRVFFCNPDGPFLSGKMDLDQGGELRFSAKCAASEGDKLKLTGIFEEHPKYGKQFRAHTGLVAMNESPEAMARLLANHSDFKGLGPVRAVKVVEAALLCSPTGEAIDGLTLDPKRVAEMANVPVDIVENAAKIWNESKGYFTALTALQDQGWSNTQSIRIVENLGQNAHALLRDDPYVLIGKIERFGFKTVDMVARKMGVKSTDPARLCAGIAYCLDRVASDGHTFTTREALLDSAVGELRPDTINGEDLIRNEIDGLVSAGFIMLDRSPLDTEFFADARLAQIEISVFDRLLAGLADSNVGAIKYDGPRAQVIMPTLNSGQTDALVGFGDRRISVISGGAGVGKTYTMRAVCEVAAENGISVALCAPTGKASRKLSHATSRDALTIHKLLEPTFAGGRFVFQRDRNNPIRQKLIICDEFSMVDVRLMHSLLNALHPDARLLLVGDHNQIPSVGPGAILRDLLAAKARYPSAVNVLTEIHRQAGVLARNITAVLDGVVVNVQCPSWSLMNFNKSYDVSAAATLVAEVESIVTAPEPMEAFGRMLDFAWDVQVLSPMRKGPLGVWALNVELQKLRQRLLGNLPPDPTPEGKSPQPMNGDRVLWTKNDAELGLANGSQAIVTEKVKGGGFKIFTEDGKEVEIPPSKRFNLEVAYAMTIHKSQGSEWPLVFLVGSSSHWIMHDRNLLYTGASRASEALVLCGDAPGLRRFASETRSERRKTLGGFMVHGWKPSKHYQ